MTLGWDIRGQRRSQLPGDEDVPHTPAPATAGRPGPSCAWPGNSIAWRSRSAAQA